MDVTITRASTLRGTVTLPADKAICHRAALACAIAKGATELRPWATAEDCQRTLDVLQGLGVRVSRLQDGIRIEGAGLLGLRAPAAPLECGESGTTMRLCCGLLASQPFTSTLNASGSLRQRPMKRIVDPLRQMGAQIEGRLQDGEIYPPLTISGKRPLNAITYRMPVASAQVKSAVLLAGLSADGPTTVVEPSPTRDHTERLLSHLGAAVRRQERAITVEPLRRDLAAPGVLRIPGDPSSAAFFLVAAAVVPDSKVTLRDVGLNPTRAHVLDVLTRMGAAVQRTAEGDGWEPRGTLTVESARLRGTTVTAEEVPLVIDELPVLMVAACAAEGETRFEGLQELKVKETDRLHSMTTGLRAMGAQLVTSPHAGLVIRGGGLRGAVVDSFGDHRTAMSLAVAGLLAEGATQVRGAECVAKSLGNFFELLASVAGSSSVQIG